MLSWLARRVLSYSLARNNAGDIRATLLMEAPDVVFRFPGQNSWAGEFHGKDQVRRWLERFIDVGLQTELDEVVATGWPWRARVCLRARDHLRGPGGELVYENRFVIWAHLRWGRITSYEVYEDTEKSAALDTWLAEHRPDLQPGPPPAVVTAGSV
jgi:ketosteroid isomerase-like protein